MIHYNHFQKLIKKTNYFKLGIEKILPILSAESTKEQTDGTVFR